MSPEASRVPGNRMRAALVLVCSILAPPSLAAGGGFASGVATFSVTEASCASDGPVSLLWTATGGKIDAEVVADGGPCGGAYGAATGCRSEADGALDCDARRTGAPEGRAFRLRLGGDGTFEGVFPSGVAPPLSVAGRLDRTP